MCEFCHGTGYLHDADGEEDNCSHCDTLQRKRDQAASGAAPAEPLTDEAQALVRAIDRALADCRAELVKPDAPDLPTTNLLRRVLADTSIADYTRIRSVIVGLLAQHATQQAALRELPRYTMDNELALDDQGSEVYMFLKADADGPLVKWEELARLLGSPTETK